MYRLVHALESVHMSQDTSACHSRPYIEGGTTVGMLRVMSRRGDDRVTWDDSKVSAGDPEAMAAVREAERIFEQERAKGATAFRIDPNKPAERIEQFDRTAEQIVLVPRVVGG
jgi:hypothetical protein